jgi:hypothetical protein
MKKRTPKRSESEELRTIFAWLSMGEMQRTLKNRQSAKPPSCPEADKLQRRLQTDFLNSLLIGNPDPAKGEFEASLAGARERVARVRTQLQEHVAAWYKFKKNARFLMMMDWDRRQAIEVYLRLARPVTVEWFPSRIAPLRYDQNLTPEAKAVELFFKILNSEFSKKARICRGCHQLFLPSRKDKESCSKKCRFWFNKHTAEGKERRQQERKRERARRQTKRQAEKRKKLEKSEIRIAGLLEITKRCSELKRRI